MIDERMHAFPPQLLADTQMPKTIRIKRVPYRRFGGREEQQHAQ